MLDLIRKGWRRVVWFFMGGKASPDRDAGESTHFTHQVSASVEVSPTEDGVETTGQEISVTTYPTTPFSNEGKASQDQSVVKCTGQEIAVTTHSAPPVSASGQISPDQDVKESTGTTHSTSPVSASVEVSPEQDDVKCTGTTDPADTLFPSPVLTARTALPYDFSRWTISEYRESPFEKCGRLYIEGDNLVIRSDLDTRGFRIGLVDVVAVLNGEPQAILLLSSGLQVGVAKLSASGKAMNFVIEPLLYTSPLSRVMDVLEGRAGKAAVFVGRDGYYLRGNIIQYNQIPQSHR